jgi:hypothetical protein
MGVQRSRYPSIAAVRQSHETLTAEHQRMLEERRRQRAEVGRPRPPEPKKEREESPLPPLPGTEDIIPLTSAAQRMEEGRIQRNCVDSYARRVKSGGIYVYKVLRPERATLAIKRSSWHSWTVAELEAAGNRRVRSFTRLAVEHWLGMHSLSI